MKLQNKFLALLLPAGALAALLILFLIHKSVHAILAGGLEKNAAALAQAAAADAVAGFESRRESRLLPLLQSLQKRQGALYAAALAPDGTVLAHTTITEKGKVERGAAALSALSSDRPVATELFFHDEPVLEVAVPVLSAPKSAAEEMFLLSGETRSAPKARLGVLKVGVPLRPAQETEARIIRQIFLIVAAIGGVAFGLVFLLIRGILRPITGLMAGIARIEGGRYDVHVPVLSKDELGELALSFNSMSAELSRTTVSKEYVEGILENMLDLLVVVDSELRIETMNRAALEALSYSAGEMSGRPLAALFQEEPAALKDLDLASSLSAGAVRDLEVMLRTKSGGGIPALFSASVLRDRDGRSRGYVGVAKDMTERKKAEQALLAAKAAAEASSKELEAFSYSVAHDLRAPLRAIDGFSQIVLDEYAGKLDAQGKDFLTRVRGGSRRMGQLIDDLLNLSRIARAEIRRETVDLSALAREIAAELRKGAPGRAADIDVEDGLKAEGDPNLLRIVLVNLLGNAWKYTARKPRAKIAFGATRVEGVRAFFVRDDGAGFDMAFAAKLFKAFSRLHSAEDFDGTGVGLATVQRVIERHGGRIWGEGRVQGGATFYFTLWEERKSGTAGGPAAA